MRNWLLLVTVAILVLTCQFTGGAYTLTFDDVSEGSTNPYAMVLHIDNAFKVADHSVWTSAPPHSGTNVLRLKDGAWTSFISMDTPPYDVNGRGVPYDAYYFGAYVSTAIGCTVKLTVKKRVGDGVAPIYEATIGSLAEEWTNKLVEYHSPEGEINVIRFEVTATPPIYSPTGVFCLDDLTIIPVPEPSSLAALACGVAGLGGVVLRRRRA